MTAEQYARLRAQDPRYRGGSRKQTTTTTTAKTTSITNKTKITKYNCKRDFYKNRKKKNLQMTVMPKKNKDKAC